MKLWLDDIRPAPSGWVQVYTVMMARHMILHPEKYFIETISLDHDAGKYSSFGGDYIKLLDWMEEAEFHGHITVDFPISIHSQNPVGVQNMLKIIRKNHWRYV